MHCRSCEILLEGDLGKLPGVHRVEANFKKGRVILAVDESGPSDDDLRRVVETAGYSIRTEPSSMRAPWFARDSRRVGHIMFALALAFFFGLILEQSGWLSWSIGRSVSPSNLSLVFFVGLVAGVSTCAALVGGLVLGVTSRYAALHLELSVRERFIPQFWFHMGRIGGFAILGGTLGWIGQQFSVSIAFTALLTSAAGLVMLLLGLQLSGLFPRLTHWTFTMPKAWTRLVGIERRTTNPYSHWGAALLGGLTFFLPCGFTQAVQLAVVAAASPLFGAIALPLFALGTVPGLLALGSLGVVTRGLAREFLSAFIAVLLVAFGLWNVTSGLQLFGVNTLEWIGSPKTVEKVVDTQYAPLENGIQTVRLTQDNLGYHPRELPQLRLGVPARLIITSTDAYSCASSFVIPEFGIRRNLQPGENVIDFTPRTSGTLPFSCSMGMFRGKLEVR